MQVRYKDVRDLSPADLVFYHLYLCAFATINKVVGTIMRHHLAGWVPVKSRYCRIVP